MSMGGLAFVYGGLANGNITLSRRVARLVLGIKYCGKGLFIYYVIQFGGLGRPLPPPM